VYGNKRLRMILSRRLDDDATHAVKQQRGAAQGACQRQCAGRVVQTSCSWPDFMRAPESRIMAVKEPAGSTRR